MNTFGKKIKDLRKEKTLTQKELAQQLSITVSTLSHWECGYQEPSFSDLIILSKYFNCSVDYLLGQTDNAEDVSITTSSNKQNRIRELRLSIELTQAELATLLGVNQSAVGKYERSELEPNIETLKKLSGVFDCSIDYILNNSDQLSIKKAKAMLRLKELRFESGKTQEEIAKILKISRQVYANYENHINEPSLDMLNSMAILFNCSVDYLLGRTDDFGNVVSTAQAQTYNADVQELVDIYDSLDEMHRVQVLEYARYFAERTQNTKRKNF